MFLREINNKGRKYLTIVESYRSKGKIKQRSIASLGRLDKLQDSEQLRRIAVSLLNYCKNNKSHFDISKLEEKSRKVWGSPKVIRKIWDNLMMDELFSKIIKDKKIRFDFFSAVFLMVLDRLCYPSSKLRSYKEQRRYYGISDNKLHNLYRALDILSDKKEDIERHLFDRNKNLFNTKVDIVFYDITTLYFESFKRDGLREFGYSKDGKNKEVQIVLGLVTDQYGIPIGYDLFPGNTFEGSTITKILEGLRDRFEIGKLIFVGDSAMLSEKNLANISNLGYEYIIGSRIKNKPEKIKKEILNDEGYIIANGKDDEVFKYKEMEINEGRRLIIGFSSKRAMKDKKDRDKLIEKAKEIIKKSSVIISKRGAARYIKVEFYNGKEIDENRIKEDERWDGYYAIETNSKQLQPLDIFRAYHNLWKIEEGFRILKSHIETRPIFHWTNKRIRGHIALCFISFLIERIMELELSKNNIEYSPYKIRKALNELQFSEIEIEGQRFYVRSKVEDLAAKILRIFKIKIPPNITSPDMF